MSAVNKTLDSVDQREHVFCNRGQQQVGYAVHDIKTVAWRIHNVKTCEGAFLKNASAKDSFAIMFDGEGMIQAIL